MYLSLNPHCEIWKAPVSEVKHNSSERELGLVNSTRGLAGAINAGPPRKGISSISSEAVWSRLSATEDELANQNYRTLSPTPTYTIRPHCKRQQAKQTVNKTLQEY